MPAATGKKGRARKQVSSGGVVFRRTSVGSEVLLIKAGGHWSFPKGSVERGETAEAAALREISEETGLPLRRLRIVSPLPDIDYAFRWGSVLVFKTVHNFLVNVSGPVRLKPQLSEIEAVRWFTPQAARRTLSFENARQTLDAALAAFDQLEQAS